MICIDSDGNYTHPNSIKLSELLNSYNLEIDFPQAVLDINVDKDSMGATLTINNDIYIFKWEESNHPIEYTIIINPFDTKQTVVELEDEEIIGYYDIDGSYYDPNL